MSKSLGSYVSAYDIAVVHAGLGDSTPAFEWTMKAVEQRHFFIGRLNVHPRLDGLRKDPRFDALLKESRQHNGLPAESPARTG